MPVKTTTLINIVNQTDTREEWLYGKFSILAANSDVPKVLDIGAGQMPYKKLLTSSGFNYMSHDFASYKPQKDSTYGLQDAYWPESGYDIVCDIKDLPEADFDLAVLTEVLEHVPDPVKALAAAIRSVHTGGHVIISVPFNSRMHQAPYWFASGLSEFFFRHYEKELNYECLEIVQVGDFVDYIVQETTLCFSWLNRTQRFAIKFLHQLRNALRRKLSDDLLSSGGLNLLILLRKK